MKIFKNPKLRLFKIEAVVIVVGIIFILVGGALEDSDLNLNQPSEDNYINNIKGENAAVKSYSEKYEIQIENLIIKFDGVKGVKAAVYVKNEGEIIAAENIDSDKSIVKESSDGKVAEENRNINNKDIVVIKDAQGNENPIVLYEVAPNIEGIALCIEGNLSKSLEERILKTLMALYDLPSSKISITQ